MLPSGKFWNLNTKDGKIRPWLGDIFAGNMIIFFHQLMFAYFSISGNTIAETKSASQEGKMFSKRFRNIFEVETMFLVAH